jgi:serine/threonine protein kinase
VTISPPLDDLALVNRLSREMAERWQRGEQPGAEEFLDRCPELWHHPRAALRLLYEEICLRQEHGQADAARHLRDRFPQWRSELAMLLDCHHLLVPPGMRRPSLTPGQTVGDFELLAELGQGGHGSVFLARQRSLADRPIVVKFTPCAGREHITLARLQHTHIVPLYAVNEDPDQDLRMLCMPYLGGAALAHLLEQLRARPPAQRSGQDVLEALDRVQARLPLAVPVHGTVRRWLAGVGYETAICWMGACLAEALQYAHDRGLVHLDLSAANVLVAADGQPMLLDFHLARAPLHPGAPGPDWLGGTPGYMPPEQAQALDALRNGQPIPAALDARADIFALGVVISEALGGPLPGAGRPPVPLHRLHPHVSVGLSDVLARCQAPAPERRYRSAGDLADDLRRHLAGRPLRGVANRSLRERWRKWYRRHPYALTVLGALLAIVAAGLVSVRHVQRQQEDARAALARDQELVAVQHKQIADQLHTVVQQLRFLAVADALPSTEVQSIEAACRELWDARQRIAAPSMAGASAPWEMDLHTDLVDLAMIWSELRVRRADAHTTQAVHQEALRTLAEAEELCGPSSALQWERRRREEALRLGKQLPTEEPAPRTAWEHLWLGRSLFWSGELARARTALTQAIDLDPQNFWAHYYQGAVAYRQGCPHDAANAFTVCIALAPRTAVCYVNRARAYTALGATARAERDYRRAVELDPSLKGCGSR